MICSSNDRKSIVRMTLGILVVFLAAMAVLEAFFSWNGVVLLDLVMKAFMAVAVGLFAFAFGNWLRDRRKGVVVTGSPGGRSGFSLAGAVFLLVVATALKTLSPPDGIRIAVEVVYYVVLLACGFLLARGRTRAFVAVVGVLLVLGVSTLVRVVFIRGGWGGSPEATIVLEGAILVHFNRLFLDCAVVLSAWHLSGLLRGVRGAALPERSVAILP